MRKADEDRFREFARGQAVLLRRCAYLLCGDWHLAEDLVQNTLFKMYGAWPRIQHTDRPVSYARRTLTRCWLDERRRPWRRSEERSGEVPDAEDRSMDPALRHLRATVRDQLFDALATVAPKQRAVLVLRYFAGMSIAETSKALRCSEGTVKSQAARGLETVRAAYFQGADFAPSDLTILGSSEHR